MTLIYYYIEEISLHFCQGSNIIEEIVYKGVFGLDLMTFDI